MTSDIQTRTAAALAACVAGIICMGCGTGEDPVALEMRVVQQAPDNGLTEMKMKVWNGWHTYFAHDEVLVTERNVIEAAPIEVNGAPAVQVTLDADARESLRRLTKRNPGGMLGMIVDGRLQSVTRIDEPIADGVVTLGGHMLAPTARRYSRALSKQPQREHDLIHPAR